MKHKGYNEFRQRGRFNFPIEFHAVTPDHPRYNMPYHWHIECEFIRILAGEYFFSLNETQINAKAGDILFIHDGVVHGGHPQNSACTYDCIVFDMNKMLKDNQISKQKIAAIFDHTLLIQHYFTPQNKEIHQTIWKLFDTMKNPLSGHEFIVQGILYQFLGHILAEKLYVSTDHSIADANHRHLRQLKNVFRLIDTAYGSPLTLEELAHSAGLSPKYFCRFFQNLTQRTPIDYLNYYRIEQACRKLIATDLSITDIALECGFNNLSYFIKTFKKYKGSTPNKYCKKKEPDTIVKFPDTVTTSDSP